MLIVVAMPFLLAACTTTVIPPANVVDPVPVAVLDHGRHASLVVPDGATRMVRYAYGDWRWFALGRTGIGEGIRAVFWPSQAALGRQRLQAPFSAAAVLRHVPSAIEDALYFEVEASDLRRLVERLDRIFAAGGAARVYNQAYALEFVPDPEPYWLLHNSNHVVARWLEELGCRVEGPTLLSRWQLGAAPAGPRHRGLLPEVEPI